jgi:putative two-component system response regulator
MGYLPVAPMEPAQKPIAQLLAKLPSKRGLEVLPEIENLSTELAQELSSKSPDTRLLFASAFQILRDLPMEVNAAPVVRALTLVAVYHYLSANPLHGIEAAELAVSRARTLGETVPLCKALKLLVVLRAETGNYPEATKAGAEGLAAAQAASDKKMEAELWLNLGTAHQYAGQYSEATACFEKVLGLSEGEPEMVGVRKLVFTNLAVASLHMNDLSRGLRAAREALALSEEPTDVEARNHRVVLETCYARLLLEAGALLDAKEHAKLARKFATEAGTELPELLAEIADALVDVHSKRTDIGLTRLKRALQRARNGRTGALQDALYAIISGYEHAKQPDVALMYLREALDLRNRVKSEQVLDTHLRHLSSFDHSVDDAIGAAVEKHQADLHDKVLRRERLKAQTEELEQATVAAELHDDTTGEHVYRVGFLSSMLGKAIGLEDEMCFLLLLAARMHDIGKLSIPDSILLKPGKLTPAEFDIIKLHTTYGADLLAKSKIPQMHIAEEIARCHHEKWDGSGYPYGLKGLDIPLAARVTALADVFDALTHARCYKPAWTIEASLDEIAKGRGSHFDPDLTDVFIPLVEQLRAEHSDLDAFLAQDAKSSAFIQARREIAGKLKGPDGHAIFDLRR